MPTLTTHRKAHHDYEILETFKAGMELLGTEAKSLRAGHASLVGAHIAVRGGETFLIGAHIPPFQEANAPKDYDPARTRRLLLTKKEIARLSALERGLTIIPLSVYTAGRFIKIEIGLARGKKKYDKRETIKRRDDLRETARAMREKS